MEMCVQDNHSEVTESAGRDLVGNLCRHCRSISPVDQLVSRPALEPLQAAASSVTSAWLARQANSVYKEEATKYAGARLFCCLYCFALHLLADQQPGSPSGEGTVHIVEIVTLACYHDRSIELVVRCTSSVLSLRPQPKETHRVNYTINHIPHCKTMMRPVPA